jgi:hypothetical protein
MKGEPWTARVVASGGTETAVFVSAVFDGEERFLADDEYRCDAVKLAKTQTRTINDHPMIPTLHSKRLS